MIRAVAVVVAVLAALVVLQGLPANVAPAVHWRYPCREHLADGMEWFTPARAFMAGRCLQ